MFMMDTFSYFKSELERAHADEEEAVVFLANIIPKKDKERIRKAIEKDPEFRVKQHLFLGMRARNALRTGGFFYTPEVMDGIWFDWLKKAVCLPKKETILTDSLRDRIKKFRASIRKPPLRPRLEQNEVTSIKERLEKRHNAKLPDVEVRYSDNIQSAFSATALKLPRYISKERREKLEATRKSLLRLKGLKDEELNGVDHHKFTVLLPRRYTNYPAGLYGALWHEFGHALAYALDVRDEVRREGIAYACGFRGLLLEAVEGKFSVEKAVDEIEHQIKAASGDPIPFRPHRWSLRVIKEHNLNLNFRNRDPNELIEELDRSIQRAIEVDREILKITRKRQLARVEKPFVGVFATIAIILLIISFVLDQLF